MYLRKLFVSVPPLVWNLLSGLIVWLMTPAHLSISLFPSTVGEGVLGVVNLPLICLLRHPLTNADLQPIAHHSYPQCSLAESGRKPSPLICVCYVSVINVLLGIKTHVHRLTKSTRVITSTQHT